MIEIPEVTNCTVCTIEGEVSQAKVAITFLDGVEKGGPVPRTTFLCYAHEREVAGRFLELVA